MKKYILITLLVLFSCNKSSEIKYSGLAYLGFNNLKLDLFKNNTFKIQLGADYSSGEYSIERDTLILKYKNKSENILPKTFIKNNNTYQSIDSKYQITIYQIGENERNSEINTPQGKFEFELYLAEYNKRIPNKKCEIEINGNDIVIKSNNKTKTIFDGILIKHKSGKWILTKEGKSVTKTSSYNEFPTIDFNKKIIEWR